MNITLDKLASYLGKDAATLLSDSPFRGWPVKRTVETGLEKPIIDYAFDQNGMTFACDESGQINTIFLYANKERCFTEEVADLAFDSKRDEVIGVLGAPSKSGSRLKDPILGEYGAWDRFARMAYTVHIEYCIDSDGIARITIMRADVVP